MPIDRVELNPITFRRTTTEVSKGYKENLILLGDVEYSSPKKLVANGEVWEEDHINRLRAGISRQFPPRLVSFKWTEDPHTSMYDYIVGEILPIPIGFLLNKRKRNDPRAQDEIDRSKRLASAGGATAIPRPHGEHDGVVIWHKNGWMKGTVPVGFAALGMVTAFALRRHMGRTRNEFLSASNKHSLKKTVEETIAAIRKRIKK